MKELFPGYYPLSEKELSKMWDDAIFVFDTNVLLMLYELSSGTREKFLAVLGDLSERLWLPHQVALEYQKKRITIIRQQIKNYRNLKKEIRSSAARLKGNIRRAIPKDRHEEAKPILNAITQMADSANEHLQSLETKHPDLFEDDFIRSEIDDLFMNKIGLPYSEEHLEEIRNEAENRYARKIPPGFSDENKSADAALGDLLLWFQTIDYAKEAQKPIFLITGDLKSDWWWIEGEKRMGGPHPVLINEIHSKAGVAFYMYPPNMFLEEAQKYLKKKIDEKAVEEIRKISTRISIPQLDEFKLASDHMSRVIEQIRKQGALGEFAHREIAKIAADAYRASSVLPRIPLESILEEAQRRAALISALMDRHPGLRRISAELRPEPEEESDRQEEESENNGL